MEVGEAAGPEPGVRRAQECVPPSNCWQRRGWAGCGMSQQRIARGASGFSACSRREHAPAQGTSRGTKPASLALSRSPHSCQSCIRAIFVDLISIKCLCMKHCLHSWSLAVECTPCSLFEYKESAEGETKSSREAEAQSASVQRGPWRFTSSIHTSASSFFWPYLAVWPSCSFTVSVTFRPRCVSPQAFLPKDPPGCIDAVLPCPCTFAHAPAASCVLRAACCVIRVIFGVFFMSASSGWFDCDPGNGSSCSRMFGGLATVELVACASFIKF